MKIFLWLLSFVPALCFAQEYVDNTNSAGLSSMQRAIDAQDIPRMEGLIKAGAGYKWYSAQEQDYWGINGISTKTLPLIDYAIRNNKPKAVDFLLNKQTVLAYSSVEVAMETSNYTLVKKLLDENNKFFLFRTIQIPETYRLGYFTNIKEQVSTTNYYSNWQLSYTWLDTSGVNQSNAVNLGTNTYRSLEKQIAKIMKGQKQKGKLLEYSSNSTSALTNIVIKSQVRKIEALRTNTYNTISSNVIELQPIILTKSANTKLALLAVAQNSIPMVDYFLDKGANINEGLLHLAVYWGNTSTVKYLLEKGANTSVKAGEPLLPLELYYHTYTPFSLVKRLLDEDNIWYNWREDRAEYKKRLPQWKEILAILKKYEE